MVGYDCLNSFCAPTYYVQQMFSNNHGNREVPISVVDPDPAAALTPLIFASASCDTHSNKLFLHLVNADSRERAVSVVIDGNLTIGNDDEGEILTGSPSDVNTIGDPLTVSPHTLTVSAAGRNLILNIPGNSVIVLCLTDKNGSRTVK